MWKKAVNEYLESEFMLLCGTEVSLTLNTGATARAFCDNTKVLFVNRANW